MERLGLPIPVLGGLGCRADRTFRLSIRIVAASIPGLDAPGVASQEKPLLEVRLGGKVKATEFADFARSGAGDGGRAGIGASSCPWRFGDELCFTAAVADVKGSGLRLKLRVQKELGLGPLRVQPRGPSDAAEGSLCLRSRGLTACVQEVPKPAGVGNDGETSSWRSPTILVPLAHMAGGACKPAEPGAPAAHVAVLLSVDWNPEEILVAAGVRPPPPLVDTRQLVEEAVGNARATSDSVEQRLKEAERKLEENIAAAKRSVCHAASLGLEEAERILPQAAAARRSLQAALTDARARSESVRRRFQERAGPDPPRGAPGRAAPGGGHGGEAEPRPAQAWSARGVEELLSAPEPGAEGWVCLRGPHGQQCWHHRSLGPAPWEAHLAPGGRPRECEAAQGDLVPVPEEPAPSAPERTRSMSVDLPLGGGRPAPRTAARAQKGGRPLAACA